MLIEMMTVFKGQGECLYFSSVGLLKRVFTLILSNDEDWWESDASFSSSALITYMLSADGPQQKGPT